MSIGLAGQWSHPDVVKAERLTIETALRKDIHPRVEIGDPAAAARYQEMGVRHFCLGWDVGILCDWWRANGTLMRERLGTEETPK